MEGFKIGDGKCKMQTRTNSTDLNLEDLEDGNVGYIKPGDVAFVVKRPKNGRVDIYFYFFHNSRICHSIVCRSVDAEYVRYVEETTSCQSILMMTVGSA